jgi:hypothetical protein
MPTVSEAARITCRDGAIWRFCVSCGQLAAMAPEHTRCDPCTRPAPQRSNPNGLRARRRAVVALAAPGVGAARDVYAKVPADAVRVAALVEIAAAAACLARTVVRLRRLDAALICPLVTDGTDLRAVLGRGRWLPTMTRSIPQPSTDPVELAALLPAVVPTMPVRRRTTRRPIASAGQASLFALTGRQG